MAKYTLRSVAFILLLLPFLSFRANAQLNWRGDTPAYPALNTTHNYTGVSSLTPNRTTLVSTSIGSTTTFSSGYPFVPSGGNSRLSMGVNFTSNNTSTSTVTTVINFSHPACDVVFNIDDIDLSGSGAPYDYVDEITITATTTSSSTINPSSISTTAINTVSGGNTITGVASGSGINTVQFIGNCITSITLSFRTGSNVKSNPNAQQYAIEDISSNETFGTPFPVNILSLSGVQVGSSIQLNWSTADELNNEGFNVQKSSDAKSFENIGFIKGQNENSTYTFEDLSPKEGYNYYRLAQKDFDGTSTLSKIIQVLYLPDGELKVFPNPALAGQNIQIEGLGENINFEVFDLKGTKIPGELRGNKLELESGNYIFKIYHPYGTESKRILVR